MRKIDLRPTFAADIRRAKRAKGFDRDTLQYVLDEIEAGHDIPSHLNPHALQREWAGCWEFHLDADLLVIYRLTEGAAVFYRIGTHAELFKK